jgi:hypothetical protein
VHTKRMWGPYAHEGKVGDGPLRWFNCTLPRPTAKLLEIYILIKARRPSKIMSVPRFFLTLKLLKYG